VTELTLLQPTRCAICDRFGNATEVYAANFDTDAFTPSTFSARRLPDRIHYRMVRCDTCGLLRSDPVAAPDLLAQLYARSVENYQPELTNIRASYGRALASLERFNISRDALLEIGCGSGFFLEQAMQQGFHEVWGVEPSESAVAGAAPALRGRIRNDVLHPGLFENNSFDVICMFQVFDHLPDPNAALDICFALLKPGGLLLALNHDAAALPARLLGEASPIIDIEHTYLYDRRSMSVLFRKHDFEVLLTGPAFNRYSLRYIAQLLPLPAALKKPLLGGLQQSPFGRVQLTVPLGNLLLIAQRPLKD
jgi:SAM-dependent methyltransferase